jgi:SAM-dependent methyltransferase
VRAIEHVHGRAVVGRRVRQLAGRLAPLIPRDASIVDVGCGDGRLARALEGLRPDLRVRGLDVLVRDDAAIPVEPFDGEHLPLEADSVDVVLFVDVLHHTLNATELLAQAKRVAGQWVIVKDHTRDGLLAGATLRFMDRVGNERHGVALPFEYWSEREWRATLDRLGFDIETWQGRLDLYPFPASLLFDRGLHFIARLGARTP